MITDSLKPIYSRDLFKLKQELELYNNEEISGVLTRIF
jgi:hypothetical protein